MKIPASALALLLLAASRALSADVHTSTREVTALAAAPDGALWAATTGGVLRRAPDGSWRKWTRADGLPSHEARAVSVSGERVTVRFPTAIARWDGARWEVEPAPLPAAAAPCRAAWRGQTWTATLTGLSDGGQERALPPSSGTHISALLPRGDELWAALYGDGIWAFDGQRWTRRAPDLPPEAREITVMAVAGGDLWLGTRREGLWRRNAGGWRQFLQPDEPYAHNVQSLAAFRGGLYAGTLEDGLVAHGPDGWRRIGAPALSSDAPRQMAVFRGRLYVRHGNGKVDAFDGEAWERDVFAALPRRQVSALAADAGRLYLAQWGGWSEWDGKKFIHHLRIPELQGVPTTAVWPEEGAVWLGSQGRGVARIARGTESLQWLGHAAGLPDDWMTVLGSFRGRVHAGTFVGGLAARAEGRWQTWPALDGRNVTDMAAWNGALMVATRHGLHRLAADGTLEAWEDGALEPEVQALCVADGALWAGGRTGLYRLGGPPAEP